MRFKILFIDLLIEILSFIFEILSNVKVVHLSYFFHTVLSFIYSLSKKLKSHLPVVYTDQSPTHSNKGINHISFLNKSTFISDIYTCV